jgi:hypothetical protein
MAFVLFVSCSKEDSTDTIAVDGNPISNNKKSNGSSSHDLLSGDIYKSMVIELVYVQGFEPSATAINNFTLNARSNKGHNGRKRSIASPGKATLQIRKL